MIIPQYAHDGDSGMDVFARDDVQISCNGRVLIPLGFKVSIPDGYEIQVRPKSGLALKKGITVLNSPGTIDKNYRGECAAILINTSRDVLAIKKGDKVAQIVLCPVAKMEFEIVESLDETTRGEGGFGSTGDRERGQ